MYGSLYDRPVLREYVYTCIYIFRRRPQREDQVQRLPREVSLRADGSLYDIPLLRCGRPLNMYGSLYYRTVPQTSMHIQKAAAAILHYGTIPIVVLSGRDL